MTAGTGDTCQNKPEPNCALCGVKEKNSKHLFRVSDDWANIWFWIRIDFKRMNKSTVFWDVLTLCGRVEVYWRFGRTCGLNFLGWRVSKASKQQAVTQDVGRMFVWNVGKLLPDYTAPHPTSRHRDYPKSHISNQLCVVDFERGVILRQNRVLYKWKSRGMKTSK
jgi:hypothetical protein